MAYNARMSIAPGSVNGKKNQRQMQEEADAFMTLVRGKRSQKIWTNEAH